MQRTLALALVLAPSLLSACSPPPPVSLRRDDASLTFDPADASLTLRRGDTTLARLPADGLQLGSVDALEDSRSYDPYWLEGGGDLVAEDPPAGLTFHAPRGATVLSQSPERLSARLEYPDGLSAQLDLAIDGEGRFRVELHPSAGARPLAFARLRLRGDAQEGFYGLGMWADAVEHRGRVRPMQIEIDATESSNNENRVPVPLLIGTRGWGLFVQSRRVGVFSVATSEPDLTQVTYAITPAGSATSIEDGGGLRFHLLSASEPRRVLARYYAITGAPLLPAPWALGPWLWRDESRDRAQVLDDIRQLRERDLATSALWIDRPYASAVNTFDFAPQFGDPRTLIDAAHAAGLRVALWSTPYLEPAAKDLRAQADAAGYFPPKSSLLLNKWSKPIDFTNPAAYASWQGLIRRYTSLGIEGFKLDYAEDVAPGLGHARNPWLFADGSDERTMHHGYPLLYHRVYAETLPPESSGGGFLLCRTGRYGDQRSVSVIWPGDMDATFTAFKERFRRGAEEHVGVGGLPATVIQGLSLSASGFPFFGADTGGYRHSPPDRELYIRWFQQTALSAVMQIGDSSSQPVWEFNAENGRDDATVDLYRLFTRLHLRLFPYEWSYAAALATTGIPIVVPFGLAYPDLGVHPSDQYLFGEDLLVAPVLQRGQTRRKVVLPPGAWLDYWDGARYLGGARTTIEVDAPLTRLPLFLREGALLPLLRPTIDTLSPASDRGVESYADDPGVLYVRVAPLTSGAASSQFPLFDGTTLAQARTGARLTLGLAPGERFRQGAVFEVLRTARPGGVTADDQALPEQPSLAALELSSAGWFHQPPPDPNPGQTPGTLWIRAPARALAQQLSVLP